MGIVGLAANAPSRAARYMRHVWCHVRPAAKRRNISIFRIIREQVALKLSNELQPDEYFYYGLDNPNIPWEEKCKYMGATKARSDWYILTPARYHFCFRNKLVFKRWLTSAGFPVAKLYGVYDPVWGRTADGAPLRNAGDLAAWMASADIADPVFKPVESAEGRMVLVMRSRKPGDRTKFVTVSGEEYSPARLAEFMSDPALLRRTYPEHAVPPKTFLIEQRLRQHPAVTDLASETLCCARIVTITTLDGRVELFETVMKLQPKPAGVDNIAHGAAAVPIAPDTGILGEGLLTRGSDFRSPVRRLPNREQDFTGVRLPFWQEAVQLAEAAARAFPEAHSVGWDIAFTEDGPYIVEGNVAWGPFHRNFGKGQWHGVYKEVVEGLQARQDKRREPAAT